MSRYIFEEWLEKAKDSPELRGRLRHRIKGILDAINEELLISGVKALKEKGKKGLVVIVDNLDWIENIFL